MSQNCQGWILRSSDLYFSLFMTQVESTLFQKEKLKYLNHIQDRLFRRGRGQKGPLPMIFSHIFYNYETWHNFTLSKEDPNHI